MITAVDSNVLIDIFRGDPQFGQRSAAALRECSAQGRLVACEVVWAETSGLFPSPDAAHGAMDRLGIHFSPLDAEAAIAAGACWRECRNRVGGRERIAADFLIGAHAQRQADRLLTRDRGFYRACFSGLRIWDPSVSP